MAPSIGGFGALLGISFENRGYVGLVTMLEYLNHVSKPHLGLTEPLSQSFLGPMPLFLKEFEDTFPKDALFHLLPSDNSLGIFNNRGNLHLVLLRV